jgi:acetyl esterase/lipase
MTKMIFAAIGLLFCTMTTHAQTNNVFPLWPDGAPGALGTNTDDIPTLTVYLPEKTNAIGAAMVILPGGGYAHLADHEGSGYAQWFKQLGIAGFVLKYRLGPKYHHPAMLQDVTRAMRIVRARAGEWNVDPNRVGVIGSSAGGHLASTVITHFNAGDTNASDPIERDSTRPDVAILCYPVITLHDPLAHKGSRINLLGTNAPMELVQELSNETQVTSNTPPCFIWSTDEDKTVPVENSFMFAEALRKAHVPFDFHVYQKGPHGLGLGVKSHYEDREKYLPWTHDCEYWLKAQKFLQ